MSLELSIVIVNFNAGPELGRCLASVREHTGAVEWEAVVVDNASTDGSEVIARGADGRFALVRNTENVGFARAVNQGVRLTSAPFVLLLNPDGYLLPGAVGELLHEMQTTATCGVAAPAVVDDAGGTDRNARGDPNLITGFFGRSTWLTRRFPNSALARRNVITSAPPAGDTGLDVDWVTGSCMLVRRAAFDAVDGLDERYFMYWEDADFCRRLRLAGWRVRYRPAALVSHSGGLSSRSASQLANRAFHDSAYLYYRTHVARSALSPLRWLAWLLLHVRSWWRGRSL